jgi:hypothetical protein
MATFTQTSQGGEKMIFNFSFLFMYTKLNKVEIKRQRAQKRTQTCRRMDHTAGKS